MLLYQGPWLAERAEAIGRLSRPEQLLPLLREILAPASSISGIDTFKGMHALQALCQEALPLWEKMDFLLLPTVPTIFTHEQIAEEPIARNSVLGRFTTFVNLMDLCALALPAGFRSDGLPFGISLIAPAFQESFLFNIASMWEEHSKFSLGATGVTKATVTTDLVGMNVAPAKVTTSPLESRTSLLVFGLHLSDQPLNHELKLLGATFEQSIRTAPRYRMAALQRGEKRLPGVWRQSDGSGFSLDGEVWSLPEESVGAFFAKVSAPLCLGSLELEDGSWVKGFLAESSVCQEALDISEFGGWKRYQAS
jgi:allophanate hydrolase